MIVSYESYIYGSTAPKVVYERNVQFEHHGIKGMKWGVRRYQNYDGTWKDAKYKRGWEANEKFKSMAKSGKKADIDKAHEYYKQNKKDIKMGHKMERKSIRQNKSANKGEKDIAAGKTTGKAIKRTLLIGAASIGASIIASRFATKAAMNAMYSDGSKARKYLSIGAVSGMAARGLRIATMISGIGAIARGVQQSRAADRASYEGTTLKRRR